MISFAQGNLLDADVEALVNTVNTVGIMGKGIALMFKERFPRNFELYALACDNQEVKVGRMFVTESKELFGPKWIINFPTKMHWRSNTRIEWIKEGLEDLVDVINEKKIRSLALPPLGCGNGGLNWSDVKPIIVKALADVDARIVIYEPTPKYLNVAKRTGVEKLTPARALVAEMVRRYGLLGIDCSILEVQKLSYFVERAVAKFSLDKGLRFSFEAKKYGPYSHNLTKLLDNLDGSYLRCDKRLSDASPFDLIWFNAEMESRVQTYLGSGEGKKFTPALEWATAVIDGFESPLGMELLATIDWLLEVENVDPSVSGIIEGLKSWPGGEVAGKRKLRLFDRRMIEIALEQLQKVSCSVH